MLKKLIKYDLKWIMNKAMFIYYAVLFLITILVKVVESMDQSFFLLIIDKIASTMFFSCSISIIITALMRVWARFTNNFYKDESYLTHTLPVSKSDLYKSKVITSTITMILSSIYIAICFLFVYLNETTWESIKIAYEGAVNSFGSVTTILMIIGLIIIVLLEMLFIMMSGIFGITIGYKDNDGKLIKSFVFGFAGYTVFNIISLIIFKILDIFTKFDMNATEIPEIGILKMLLFVSLILYLLYNVIYYLVGKHVFNKGVNVD